MDFSFKGKEPVDHDNTVFMKAAVTT